MSGNKAVYCPVAGTAEAERVAVMLPLPLQNGGGGATLQKSKI